MSPLEAARPTKDMKIELTAQQGREADKEDIEEGTETTTATMTASGDESESTLIGSCYCSVTHLLMEEPVVHPNGNSVEKSAIQDDAVAHYPNRVLQAYMERETKYSALGNAAEEGGPLPDSFYCPISFQLIREPKIDYDGYTYEADSIRQWIQVHGDSPVTRKPLAVDDLYENKALRKLLREELQHPAIRQWRDDLLVEPSKKEVSTKRMVKIRLNSTANTTALNIESAAPTESATGWTLWCHRVKVAVVAMGLLAAAGLLMFMVRGPIGIFGAVILVAACVRYCFCAYAFYGRENVTPNDPTPLPRPFPSAA